RIEEVRRVVLVDAESPAVVDGVIQLGVGLEEADVLLHDVAVGEEDRGGRDRADVAARNAAGEDVVGATSARIQVTPDAEVEGRRTEGRADTAVDVDFGCGAVRE